MTLAFHGLKGFLRIVGSKRRDTTMAKGALFASAGLGAEQVRGKFPGALSQMKRPEPEGSGRS